MKKDSPIKYAKKYSKLLVKQLRALHEGDKITESVSKLCASVHKNIAVLHGLSFVLIFTLFGCVTKKEVQKVDAEKQQVNTLRTEEVKNRDSTLKFNESTAEATGALKQAENGSFNMDTIKTANDRQELSVSVKNGRVSAKCRCLALEAKIKVQDKIIRELKDQTKEVVKRETVSVTVEKPYVPLPVKILAGIGAISMLGGAYWFLSKLKLI